jgi:transcriptional regulator with XRE-family HTH domain
MYQEDVFMGKYSDTDITKLQNNLLLIRNAGGWTAEVFGDMIGVTKQTISNLENKKTEMTKTQYIAIRAVLDYEMEENPNREILKSAVNLALHSDKVSEEDQKKIQAFVSGAQKTGLDSAAVIAGIGAIIGVVAAEAIASPALVAASGAWLAKLLKNKRD